MNKRLVIGAGIIILLLLLLRKKKKPQIAKTQKETKVADKPQTIDLSDIPEECLDGFELDGVKYKIENNKFIKS